VVLLLLMLLLVVLLGSAARWRRRGLGRTQLERFAGGHDASDLGREWLFRRQPGDLFGRLVLVVVVLFVLGNI